MMRETSPGPHFGAGCKKIRLKKKVVIIRFYFGPKAASCCVYINPEEPSPSLLLLSNSISDSLSGKKSRNKKAVDTTQHTKETNNFFFKRQQREHDKKMTLNLEKKLVPGRMWTKESIKCWFELSRSLNFTFVWQESGNNFLFCFVFLSFSFPSSFRMQWI